MFPLTITPVQDERDLVRLRNFLLTQPQSYPHYQKWVDEKCVPRIESGIYQNLVAFYEGRAIANSIFRILSSRVDIKNFRLDKDYRGRDLGHFLLTQIIKDNPDKPITTDVTSTNLLALSFFLRNGFQKIGSARLYSPNRWETILVLNQISNHQ